MKSKWIFLLLLTLAIQCASSNSKDSSEGDGKLVDSIIQKAQSEEGQKAIQTAKEKLQDKETQEKLKGLVSKDKKK
ncbi:hypothetical protein [Leptospira ilyithenensis]|uniref:Lipoprotein n=1 Tax=Leptospira ilyithenensis TaxID=2484901 RepID=A0A4V3JWX8_9LEPT|nr:hypothetical protein [Leptospira ilyithenensis]TGN08468.1 hypothetical protein EHS11_16360 [Leptospira ilyithenensis]